MPVSHFFAKNKSWWTTVRLGVPSPSHFFVVWGRPLDGGSNPPDHFMHQRSTSLKDTSAMIICIIYYICIYVIYYICYISYIISYIMSTIYYICRYDYQESITTLYIFIIIIISGDISFLRYKKISRASRETAKKITSTRRSLSSCYSQRSFRQLKTKLRTPILRRSSWRKCATTQTERLCMLSTTL